MPLAFTTSQSNQFLFSEEVHIVSHRWRLSVDAFVTVAHLQSEVGPKTYVGITTFLTKNAPGIFKSV